MLNKSILLLFLATLVLAGRPELHRMRDASFTAENDRPRVLLSHEPHFHHLERRLEGCKAIVAEITDLISDIPALVENITLLADALPSVCSNLAEPCARNCPFFIERHLDQLVSSIVNGGNMTAVCDAPRRLPRHAMTRGDEQCPARKHCEELVAILTDYMNEHPKSSEDEIATFMSSLCPKDATGCARFLSKHADAIAKFAYSNPDGIAQICTHAHARRAWRQ
ncbi:hypothetical protein J8273_5524 [Carpediemonas membranifera]|uniref:Uncharacterized protein n=1 Tax=Carpediemonas membranifera TaxID=201153 RepID=A0A8J6B408_9EUKA|nr:hypothetical protein J8273_5524 [Carpediemonas membranifera]|eukprot:KAG9392519.1 hypothetical protein J8273_5524 [Carpediemonas membranifera]